MKKRPKRYGDGLVKVSASKSTVTGAHATSLNMELRGEKETRTTEKQAGVDGTHI